MTKLIRAQSGYQIGLVPALARLVAGRGNPGDRLRLAPAYFRGNEFTTVFLLAQWESGSRVVDNFTVLR